MGLWCSVLSLGVRTEPAGKVENPGIEVEEPNPPWGRIFGLLFTQYLYILFFSNRCYGGDFRFPPVDRSLVDGLLFGLAIKKGILSFVLLIIAMFIAAYVGFAFVPPHVSISSLASSVMPYVKQYVGEVTKSLSLGFGGSLSLTVVLFLIGLGIGLWKG